MTKIAVIVGSLRAESFNNKLVKIIEALAPSDVEFNYVNVGNLPLFNEELEANYPAEARELKDIVEAADGVLFATPEYNRGYSGVIKNAIDWGSRPWGSNSFEGKPAAVVGASASRWGTTMAQTQLKSVLIYLDMKLMGQPEVYIAESYGIFDDNGQVDDEVADRLKAFTEKFIQHVRG